jgi:hypothetical protein
MIKKLNCWEIEKCGREPGGAKIAEHGECPAATETSANGINEGKNGGRICWAIAGTFCSEKAKGISAKEKFTCMSCDFFKLVNEEEDINDYEILTPEQLKEFLANCKKL